jgi:hypothetical protein
VFECVIEIVVYLSRMLDMRSSRGELGVCCLMSCGVSVLLSGHKVRPSDANKANRPRWSEATCADGG